MFADAVEVQVLDDDDFADYAVADEALDDLRATFISWRIGLLDP